MKEPVFEKYDNMSLDEVYIDFYNQYNADPLLVNHRSFIEAHGLGYGNRPFHAMWRELVKLMPDNFNFLEIGVYKGQVLSLIKLLSDNQEKDVRYIGVTPLDKSGDKFSEYDSADYVHAISNLFRHFNLDFSIEKNIIRGLSTDESVKDKVIDNGPFDLIYIDGSHDYDCVVSDINLMYEISKKGSIIVFDDSSCFADMNIDLVKFKGHIDVCNAVRDHIENNEQYVELLCVGHNRVFKRIA